jgi:hypothetical protein
MYLLRVVEKHYLEQVRKVFFFTHGIAIRITLRTCCINVPNSNPRIILDF